MKKLALVGALAVAACTPDIPQTAPQDHAIVAFNPAGSPPVVPSPNDLAIDPATGKVNAPIDTSSSPANQEFTSDYINTLDGFPTATAASAMIEGGDLDPATVTPQSVLVNDLTAAATGGNPQVAVTPVYDPATHQIVVPPPNGAWTKGHKYEVVVISAPGTGVQVQGGGQVYGSVVWALARSNQPLVECQGDACRSLTSLVSDPNQAKQLEQLRQGYAPLLDALAQAGVPREAVPALWTFTITSQPEMRFDPASSVIPFPNNLATKPLADGGVQVNLPIPDGGILPDGGMTPTAQLITALNTLDGFSTTAPIVTENADEQPALTDGAKIDPATVTAQTAAVIPLVDPSTIPPQNIQPCVLPDMPGCATSSALPDGGYQLADGGTPAQQLQFVPVVPLEGHTPYGAFVTTNVKAQGGKSVAPTVAFALMRLANPLVDGSNHSTIPGVTDAEAQQLEPIRAALKPFFDALDAKGIHRKDLALAWNFNTQTTVSTLKALAGVVQNPQLPSAVGALADQTTTFETNNQFPNTHINKIYTGEIADPFLLTGTGGTINPNPAKALVQPIPFVLVTPKNIPAGTAVPVVIFGHGFTSTRYAALGLADTLASVGIATIAIDEVWHGDRSSCTGSAPAIQAAGVPGATDDYACGGPQLAPNPNGQKCDEALPIGHCVNPTGANSCTYLDPANGDAACQAAGQGICLPTGKCSNGDFWRVPPGYPKNPNTSMPQALWGPAITGWNIFNPANLFQTRDNFRQQVVDNSQLERVIKEATATGNLNQVLTSKGDVTLDANKIHYAGQSLGGILGTLYTAASSGVQRSLLNVPAGDLVQVFLTSGNSNVAALRTLYLQGLKAQGIVPATPQFDDVLAFDHMILDPADPVNAGYATTHQGAPSGRQTFIQYIEGDTTLINPTTEALIAATVRDQSADTCAAANPTPPCADVFEFTETYCKGAGCTLPAPADRHGFLLNNVEPTTTAFAQSQAAAFLAAGALKTTFP